MRLMFADAVSESSGTRAATQTIPRSSFPLPISSITQTSSGSEIAKVSPLEP